MSIYLPIAELSMNIFTLLGLGFIIGYLSGLFGVGGGFLMTPMLIFLGIPSPIAVGSGANMVVASSISGMLAHWHRKNVDFKMGAVLLTGGLMGSTLGAFIFQWLSAIGQIDFIIRLSYVLFLGVIGVLMFIESLKAIFVNFYNRLYRKNIRKKLHHHNFLHHLPFKMRFHRSGLYISAILPILIGVFVGMLSSIMGVGGGFVMVPAMIYLLGMPTNIVVGTSLFQILFVAANATFFQAYLNQTVDIILAFLLLIGSVVGAQYGTKLTMRLKSEQLRILLAIIVLVIAVKMAIALFVQPDDIFTLELIND